MIFVPGKYVGSAEIYNPDAKKSKIIGTPKYPYKNGTVGNVYTKSKE